MDSLTNYKVYTQNINKNINNGEMIWKDVPDFEGVYQISNTGIVKSLNNRQRKVKEHILKPIKSVGGYVVRFYKKDQRREFVIHTLVKKIFGGERWKFIGS